MKNLERFILGIAGTDDLAAALAKPVHFDSEKQIKLYLDMLCDIYNERMPFNRYLGVRVDSLSLEKACVAIEMREELVGNYGQKILHGGVISSVIDLTGGIIAQANAWKNLKGLSMSEIAGRLYVMSTMNIRVDYLRPGGGERFICTGLAVRAGSKVAVTRMELCNDTDDLVAMGTGTYLIG